MSATARRRAAALARGVLLITLASAPAALGAQTTQDPAPAAPAAAEEPWRAQAQELVLGLASAISGVALHGSPAINLAQRLDMLPGVSVDRVLGDARYARIRGLDPRWTAVRLDGVRLPSSELGARMTPLNVLPAPLVDRVEVTRTPSPDRDADAIGGAIELVPRLPHATLRGQASVSGGFREQRADAGEAGGQLMVGRRASAGRVGLLGAASLLRAPLSAGGIDVVYVSDMVRQPSLLGVSSHDVTRQQYGGYGAIDVETSASSRLTFRALASRLRDDVETRRVSYDAASLQGSMSRSLFLAREDDILAHGSVSGQRAASDRTLIDFRASYGYAWSRPEELLSSFFASGVRFAPTSGRGGIDPETLTAQPINEPAAWFRMGLGGQQLVKPSARERTFQGGVNVTRSLADAGALRATLKSGVKVGLLSHSRDDDHLRVGSDTGRTLADVDPRDFDGGRFLGGRYTLGLFPSPDALRGLAGASSQVITPSSLLADFRGDEQIVAGYAMTELSVGDRLVIAPGVRYEYTRFDYGANAVTIGFDDYQVAASNGESSTGEWLPMVTARYAIADGYLLRASVARTLARPDYDLLAPSVYVPYAFGTSLRGNPALKNTMAWGTDVMLERTLPGGGSLFGGAFHKAITRPVFSFLIERPVGGPANYTVEPRNGGDARLIGLEAGYQQRLTFLPGPLGGLSVWSNYTFGASEADVPARSGDGSMPIFPEIAGRDVTLPGVARHTLHASVAYTRAATSARLFVSLRGRSLDGIGPTVLGDVLQARRTQLDASIQQRAFGPAWLFVDLYNLTSAPVRYYQNLESRTVREQDYRWWASFGLRFQF